jgi:hypothetical protein
LLPKNYITEKEEQTLREWSVTFYLGYKIKKQI